jgi:predicted small metal-binding protein
MQVIECNECGETLQAAENEELVRILGSHLKSEHDIEADEEELTELVESEAYEAMDS